MVARTSSASSPEAQHHPRLRDGLRRVGARPAEELEAPGVAGPGRTGPVKRGTVSML